MNADVTLEHETLGDAPAYADEVDTEFVQSLKRQRLTTPVTRVLLVLIVLGVGFLLGAFVQRERAPSSSATPSLPAGLAQLFNGTAGGQGGQAGSGNGSVNGTVKLVDGNNVYISDAQGNVTKATTDASTKIKVSKDGTLADLDPSKRVTIEGTKNADGSYSATSITESSGTLALPGGAGLTPPTGQESSSASGR